MVAAGVLRFSYVMHQKKKKKNRKTNLESFMREGNGRDGYGSCRQTKTWENENENEMR